MRAHRFLAVALTATAFALPACGSDDLAESSDSGVGPADSVDEPAAAAPAGDPTGAWVLVSGPSDPIVGWDVTMEIEGDRVGGTAACNGYGGSVDIDDGTIAVGELAATEMGCQDDVQQLEQEFLTSLSSATAYSTTDDQLELTTPQGTWRFDRLAPIPTAELVGTTWVLDGYLDGDTVSNEAGMDASFFQLSGDGTISGATNCRTLSGTWIESAGEIVFTEFAADGDCSDAQAWDLDSRIVTVLGDGFRAAVDGDRLTLTAQGGEGLTFRVAP